MTCLHNSLCVCSTKNGLNRGQEKCFTIAFIFKMLSCYNHFQVGCKVLTYAKKVKKELSGKENEVLDIRVLYIFIL